MRIVILLMVLLLSSCSWWPLGAQRTGNCLDDNSCGDTSPLEQQLIGGTWYCYGESRQEPWECSQTKDDDSINVITDQPRPSTAFSEPESTASDEHSERAELTFEGELISTSEQVSVASEPYIVEAAVVEESVAEAAVADEPDDGSDTPDVEMMESSQPEQDLEPEVAPETDPVGETMVEPVIEKVVEKVEPAAVIAAIEQQPAPSEPEVAVLINDLEAIVNSADESAPAEMSAVDKLLEFPDDAYAVQLIALQSINEVENFATMYNIKKPMYVHLDSQDSDWYVLILDVFDTQVTAIEAANDWELKHNPNSRPWVRPLGPLKRAVTRAQPAGN